MAADLADRGFHSLRLEWHGIGDSTGAIDEYIMDEPFLDEAFGAAQLLRDEGWGASPSSASASAPAPRSWRPSGCPTSRPSTSSRWCCATAPCPSRSPQRLVDDLPTSEFFKRLGKLRHIGDAKRRRLYIDVCQEQGAPV